MRVSPPDTTDQVVSDNLTRDFHGPLPEPSPSELVGLPYCVSLDSCARPDALLGS